MPDDPPQTDTALLALVADIRAAVGDPLGRLMQDELVARCRILGGLAGSLRALARKWEQEAERCSEAARTADEEWDTTDACEWRERRAVYLECARELDDALGIIP